MDTSDTYIKMCEKAEEIQKVAPDMLGHHWRKDNIHILNGDWYWMEISLKGISRRIWLPRQGQLQEMLQDITTNDSLNQSAFLYKWINANVLYANEFNVSMEQLWLAFVMKEKFNKVWDGEGWVINDLNK